MSSPVPATRGLVPVADTYFSSPCRAIYVGGGGNLVVTGLDGVDYTLVGVLAGLIYPIQATRVRTSTATNLVALF